jgi:hypothetical protein
LKNEKYFGQEVDWRWTKNLLTCTVAETLLRLNFHLMPYNFNQITIPRIKAMLASVGVIAPAQARKAILVAMINILPVGDQEDLEQNFAADGQPFDNGNEQILPPIAFQPYVQNPGQNPDQQLPPPPISEAGDLSPDDQSRFREISALSDKQVLIIAQIKNASDFNALVAAKTSTIVKILRWEISLINSLLFLGMLSRAERESGHDSIADHRARRTCPRSMDEVGLSNNDALD